MCQIYPDNIHVSKTIYTTESATYLPDWSDNSIKHLIYILYIYIYIVSQAPTSDPDTRVLVEGKFSCTAEYEPFKCYLMLQMHLLRFSTKNGKENDWICRFNSKIKNGLDKRPFF